MTELTIEERRKQIAEQQEALRKQEEELAHQQREAEREALRLKNEQERLERIRKEQERNEKFLQPIRASIAVIRPNLKFSIDGSYFKVLKEENPEHVAFSTYIDIKERDTDRWSSRPSGKFDITVGNYGDKDRFPPKKDGSHSYDKIAACLIGRYDDEMYKREVAARNVAIQAQQKSTGEFNAPLAALLVEQFNLTKTQFDVKGSIQKENMVVVHLPQKVLLTPERATELLKLLNDSGFIERQ